MAITFNEDISAGNASIEFRKKTARDNTQIIADEKGEEVTGTYKLGDGEYYTYTAYPSKPKEPAPKKPSGSSTPGTHMNSDTIAHIQRGTLQQPGFYGSQELSDSNQDFNDAVGIASSLVGFAKRLKSQPKPPSNYVRTPTNYILTELEKLTIQRKAKQLASVGVVPYDTLENFLYVLAATEGINDLVFIAEVIGIPELGQSKYIRNIRAVCDLPDIYKIGYLSQGLASINQRYARQFSQVELMGDINQSYYGSINRALNLSSELGVLGPVVLSAATNLTGAGKYLSAAPNLSSGAITTAINVAGNIFGGSSFSPRALSPSTINTILNPSAIGNLGNIASNLGSLNGITGQLGASIGGALGGQLGASIGGSLGSGLISGLSGNISGAVGGALNGLLSSSPLGGALAAFGGLGGLAAGAFLSQTGGNAVGSFMSEILTGNRIKSAQIANNPMLQPPSFAGKSFFGEAPVALPAIDQVFCKSIGAFGTATGGGGVVSFSMQNFASMGGSLPVGSLISKMVTGSFDIPSPTTFFGSMVGETISNVCSSLNVPLLASIEPRRSDNAIPFMIGLGAGILGEKFSPFGSSPITNGWKLAASVANDVQRYNPQFLETCRTSL